MRAVCYSHFLNPRFARDHLSRTRSFPASPKAQTEFKRLPSPTEKLKMLVEQRRRAETVVLNPVMFVAVGALALGVALAAGCGRNVAAANAGSPPPMPVSVVKAEQRDVPVSGEWVGTLDGYVNAQI